MKLRRLLPLLAFAALLPAALHAQAAPAAPQKNDQLRTLTREELDVVKVLTRQENAWNKGDLDAFATGYKNSPDTLFVGHQISRGYDQMLAAYKASYRTPEKMGQLLFTQLDTQRLDDHFATVTGRFHLDRTPAGGGNADGYFLLVVEMTPAGWKIVRDDTTASTPAPLPDSIQPPPPPPPASHQ